MRKLGLAEQRGGAAADALDAAIETAFDAVEEARSFAEACRVAEALLFASAEPLDRKALDDTYKRINDLRQQRFDAGITARSQIEGVLTAEQKERFRSFGPGWPGDID